jgi:hypothetical protein
MCAMSTTVLAESTRFVDNRMCTVNGRVKRKRSANLNTQSVRGSVCVKPMVSSGVRKAMVLRSAVAAVI